VVVGGLLTSTLITLYLVPVVYSGLAEWQLRRAEKKRQAEMAGAEPAFADE
jgi:cytochrome oxidase assembly protein ShyY1